MFEPFWKDTSERRERREIHRANWLVNWTWAIIGLVGGALVAPSLLQLVGLAHTSYTDGLVIAVAVVAGLLVQLLGTVLSVLSVHLFPIKTNGLGWYVIELGGCVVVLFPLVGVGYGIYRYLTWVGPGQRSVTVAFVGGLLIKTFVIPAIWGAIKSSAFQAFMRWLRGDKVKTRDA